MNAQFIGEFDALAASYVGCEDKKTRLYRVCQDCSNGFTQIPHLELRQLRKCDVENIRSQGFNPDRFFIVSGSYICPKCGSVGSFISDPISIDDPEAEVVDGSVTVRYPVDVTVNYYNYIYELSATLVCNVYTETDSYRYGYEVGIHFRSAAGASEL